MIIKRTFSDLQSEIAAKTHYHLIPEIDRIILDSIRKKEYFIGIPIDLLTSKDEEVEFVKEKLAEAGYIIDCAFPGTLIITPPDKLDEFGSCYFKMSKTKLIPAKYALAATVQPVIKTEKKTFYEFLSLLVDEFFKLFDEKLDLALDKFKGIQFKDDETYVESIEQFEIFPSDVLEKFMFKTHEDKKYLEVAKEAIEIGKKIKSDGDVTLSELFELLYPLFVFEVKKEFERFGYPFSKDLSVDKHQFLFTLDQIGTLSIK